VIQKLALDFKGQAFVNNLHTEQIVHVHVNGRLVDTWRFNYPHADIDNSTLLNYHFSNLLKKRFFS
jgi:hypothetical protein